MKIKLRQFYLGFTAVTTSEAILFIISNALAPEIITVAYLRMFLLVGFILSAIGPFLFTKGLSPKSLWIRRILICVFGLVISLTAIIVFDLVSLHSFAEYAEFIAAAAMGAALFGFALFLIADKAEKKLLERINAKLEGK